MERDLGFDEDDLRALAGPRSFERGRGYLAAVTAVEVGDGWIAATVYGTDAYQTELTIEGPHGLAGECDCPYGMEGNFCKHVVALGLTMLAKPEAVPRQRSRARTRAQELDAWLASLSRDELLALVREQVAEDRQLVRRLELRAASARGDLGEVRARIWELFDTLRTLRLRGVRRCPRLRRTGLAGGVRDRRADRRPAARGRDLPVPGGDTAAE